MAAHIRVEGLHELVRAFGKIDKDLRRDLQRELADVAKIVTAEVRLRAERYRGVGRIRERVRGSSAYVEDKAPSRGIRPDFGALLIRTAFLPALEAKKDEVVDRLDQMLGRLAGEEGF